MELFHAHDQWARRPDDERFSSIRALYDATRAYAATAVELDAVKVAQIRVEASTVNHSMRAVLLDDDVRGTLTHWSFGQLASRVGAPAGYLRTLPPTLAANNLNHGLARLAKEDPDASAQLLFHANGKTLLRAVTSERYSRIWNHEVAERLLELESRGWAPARPTFNQIDDRLPLYASDHDMFAFIVHPDRVVKEDGNPDGLLRGLIASNSEVGAGKLRVLRFLYRGMCGNHIIWGAEDVIELAAVHVGGVRDKFALWQRALSDYLDESARDDEARVARAKTLRVAESKPALLDLLFGMRLGLTRRELEAGYDAVVPDEDGGALYLWGIVQGITRSSQATPYADARMRIDAAAGRLLGELL